MNATLTPEHAMKTTLHILTFCVIAVAKEFSECDDNSATSVDPTCTDRRIRAIRSNASVRSAFPARESMST